MRSYALLCALFLLLPLPCSHRPPAARSHMSSFHPMTPFSHPMPPSARRMGALLLLGGLPRAVACHPEMLTRRIGVLPLCPFPCFVASPAPFCSCAVSFTFVQGVFCRGRHRQRARPLPIRACQSTRPISRPAVSCSTAANAFALSHDCHSRKSSMSTAATTAVRKPPFRSRPVLLLPATLPPARGLMSTTATIISLCPRLLLLVYSPLLTPLDVSRTLALPSSRARTT